jgi:hypothetical protein
MLLSAAIYRGQLRQQEPYIQQQIKKSLEMATLSGDLQRLYMVHMTIYLYLLSSGRLGSAEKIVHYMKTIHERYHLPHWHIRHMELQGTLQLVRGEYALAYQSFVQSHPLHRPLGNFSAQLTSNLCRTLSALLQSRPWSAEELQRFLEITKETVELWLHYRLVVAHQLSIGLAAIALCCQRLGSLPLSLWRAIKKLRQKMHHSCQCNRLETPLYGGGCAALELLQGKSRKAAKLFARAIEIGQREGNYYSLVFIYRLAARLYPAGSGEAQYYHERDVHLTETMKALPALPYKALLQGSIGPLPRE